MSTHFYSEVSRFFHLLDLDGDGLIDPAEAYLGFNACYDEVYPASMNGGGEGGEEAIQRDSSQNREHTVQQQVAFLFQATRAEEQEQAQPNNPDVVSASNSSNNPPPSNSHSPSAGITLDSFKHCYSRLLASAYEEEVLLVDLQRAIKGLEEENGEWKQMQTFFHILQNQLPLSNPSELNALFLPITGRSQILGPKKQKEARKLVEPLLLPANQPISKDVLVRVCKQLLSLPIPIQVLMQGAQEAIKGNAASSSSSSSSSSSESSSSSSSASSATSSASSAASAPSTSTSSSSATTPSSSAPMNTQ